MDSATAMLKAAGAMVLVLASLLIPAFSQDSATGNFCKGWHFSVEVDNLSPWNVVPETCEHFVAKYMTGSQYLEDSEVVVENAVDYARSLNASEDGKDAWIFDIDETSLSNVPFYALHQFGAEPFNEETFNSWVAQGEAPVLPATLKLYNEVKKLGIRPIFLTGRDEAQRNITAINLLKVGYSDWEDLILRQEGDAKIAALAYKSAKRKELVESGYNLVGNIGDQWSDLRGYSIANRSFKLPNPMYYIP